jgi:hypothetical protein
VEYFASKFSMDVRHPRRPAGRLRRIVREGSFNRAALALGLGQPGQLASALEAAVGGALFTRGRRSR